MMELQTRVKALLDEIEKISEENRRYQGAGNQRDLWQRFQNEKRRRRLEEIREELYNLKNRKIG